jgi:starch phosphorylase
MKDKLKKAYEQHLSRSLAKRPDKASMYDKYQALALSVRDLMVDKWIATQAAYEEENPRTAYYVSLEYLIGRTMGNAMINLGLNGEAQQAMQDLGLDLDAIREEEADAGLGNGGLGRLAACYLDSMATLNLPAFGYGIRYDYGIFKQIIDGSGNQIEEPDNWLRQGNVWEIQRPERARIVRFYGRTEACRTSPRRYKRQWVETQDVLAMPYDTPIPGYRTNTVNSLRLWSAKALTGFSLTDFNQGDFLNANLGALLTENITKVLYPNDHNYEGKELRVKQQYFLVSASVQDILRRYLDLGNDIHRLHEKVSIQLNDTHPAFAVPELMRLLIDEHDLSWDEAWGICTRTFNYTNHTLMSEALERWPVEMLEKLLPRILEIVYEINARFLRQVANRHPGDLDRLGRMSLIEESRGKEVRMAYMAVVASHRVNGVAALHTELLKDGLFRDFHEFYPGKFVNVTNGITPRRWLRKANPGLAKLISGKIGEDWVRDLDQLGRIAELADDAGFRKEFRAVKRRNKELLAAYIQAHHGIKVDPEAMFDVQVKRLHEYKRQLLNVLRCIAMFLEIKDNPQAHVVPRVVIFAAKAAPGYFLAKLIIRLINAVGAVLNHDEEVAGRLKVVFLANYRVSLAEKIIPAADLSEQISLAGTEASGTGNMKFALNGSLTIGTMDGANIEIHDAVGEENIFIFGMRVAEVEALRASGYRPQEFIERSPRLRRALELIRCGFFSQEDPEVFQPVVDSFQWDPYMVAADFDAYWDCQQGIDDAFRKPANWDRRAIINAARMGYFSSDRSIREYADKIWELKPYRVRKVMSP